MGFSITCRCKYSLSWLFFQQPHNLPSSKAHFQRALSATISRQLDAGADDIKLKLHRCPHKNCPNQYKQLSGLRYHLSHVRTTPCSVEVYHPADPILQGHQQQLPTQLNDVPPTLARRVALKIQEQLQGQEDM